MACRLLSCTVQLFVVGRVQLLIANSQVTRPETRTFGYYGPGTAGSGAFLRIASFWLRDNLAAERGHWY